MGDGGIILGVVLTFVWLFVAFVAAFSLDPNGSTTAVQDVLIFGFFVLPFIGAIVLLCFRRTRQAGAGLVMGMAIGSLALAGCLRVTRGPARTRLSRPRRCIPPCET